VRLVQSAQPMQRPKALGSGGDRSITVCIERLRVADGAADAGGGGYRYTHQTKEGV
jgi:hypothetical protein